MKTQLIHSYYKLMQERTASKFSGMSELNSSIISYNMLRIDAVLYERYRYDISITRKN
jgi:hypothetical protein